MRFLLLVLLLAAAAAAEDASPEKVGPGSRMTAAALSDATWIQGDPLQEFEPGRVYLVECWATWCGPCIAAIPHVNELHKAYRDRGLRVIGANVFEDDVDVVRSFVAERQDGMSYPVVFTGTGSVFESEWLKAAGIRGIPNAFVVRDGTLLMTVHPAHVTNEMVEALLADEVDMERVRKELARGEAARQDATKLVRNCGAALDGNDPALAETMLRALEQLDPAHPFLPMLRIRLHVMRDEWGSAAAAFAAADSGLPRMLCVAVLTAAITGEESHGFTQPVVELVLDAFSTIVAMKGERAGPLDFATRAALAWHADRKNDAAADAARAVRLARADPEPQTSSVELFQQFAAALAQDKRPCLAKLQAARRRAVRPAASEP